MKNGALQNPLDRLEHEIRRLHDEAIARTEYQRGVRMGLSLALDALDAERREQAAIDAEHVPGRTYSPE
jgi:hypothetical protein